MIEIKNSKKFKFAITPFQSAFETDLIHSTCYSFAVIERVKALFVCGLSKRRGKKKENKGNLYGMAG